MPNRKPWRVDESALGDLEGAVPKVAVLPFGATEPHGRHLPYGTDTYQVEAIADRAAALAHQQGTRVAVLPAIPFGVQTTQRSYPFAMNLYPSTLSLILSNVAESLEASGVTRAVILNGHGGNDFYPWLKESHGKHNVYFVQVNWFDVRQDSAEELFAGGGDHANELETSLVLHLRPELVDMAAAGDQAVGVPRISAMREGWARAPVRGIATRRTPAPAILGRPPRRKAGGTSKRCARRSRRSSSSWTKPSWTNGSRSDLEG